MNNFIEMNKPPAVRLLFHTLDISVMLSRILHLNKRFDASKKKTFEWSLVGGGFDPFEALAGVAFDHLNSQHTREFD